jgi:hypothetical protein
VLGDPLTTKNLTHILTRSIEEGDNETSISSFLSKGDIHHVSRRKHMRREFKMIVELGKYQVEGIMLDLGFYVNIFTKKLWDLMGKPKMVWSLIQN